MKSRNRIRSSKTTPRSNSAPTRKDERITKQKRKPEDRYVGTVEGAPARARLDRPSRRIYKADGGPLPSTLYRRRANAVSDADRDDADFYRRAAATDGAIALGSAATGDLPMSAAFGLSSLYGMHRGSVLDTQAQDRDAQGAAVEDLVNRSRGTDLRSRVFGPQNDNPYASSFETTDARRFGGRAPKRKKL